MSLDNINKYLQDRLNFWLSRGDMDVSKLNNEDIVNCWKFNIIQKQINLNIISQKEINKRALDTLIMIFMYYYNEYNKDEENLTKE